MKLEIKRKFHRCLRVCSWLLLQMCGGKTTLFRTSSWQREKGTKSQSQVNNHYGVIYAWFFCFNLFQMQTMSWQWGRLKKRSRSWTQSWPIVFTSSKVDDLINSLMYSEYFYPRPASKSDQTKIVFYQAGRGLCMSPVGMNGGHDRDKWNNYVSLPKVKY